jgi:hypothetical protein
MSNAGAPLIGDEQHRYGGIGAHCFSGGECGHESDRKDRQTTGEAVSHFLGPGNVRMALEEISAREARA